MQLLTLREAASKLKLKEETVRRYCRNGDNDIPAIKISKGYRFIESELERWIKDKRIPEGRKN